MPSLIPPCICASRPRGLIDEADVDGEDDLGDARTGDAVADLSRLTVAGRQSISTRQALTPLYSLWIAIPCAVPGGIVRPQSPTSATLSSTAAHPVVAAGTRGGTRSGSLPIASASWSTTSSRAARTSGE